MEHHYKQRDNRKFFTHSPICRVQWVGFRKELGSLNRKMRKTNPTAKKFATKKNLLSLFYI